MTLRKSDENCEWHIFTVSVLEVVYNLMKNLYLLQRLVIINRFWLMGKLLSNVAEVLDICF